MKHMKFYIWLLFSVFAFLVFVRGKVVIAGNIDPDNDGSQYAWAENLGRINLEPSDKPGVTVADDGLSGFAWGENIGWINLNGVINDGEGNLSGWTWGENTGRISFSCVNTDSCVEADFGVSIGSCTGEFSGYAWGENTGWINLSGIKTSWLPDVDGDGIPDCHDLCPHEDATGIDADGDGCIDTLSGLNELIERLVTEGKIDEAIKVSLISQIENAQSIAEMGNILAAVRLLDAFISEVNAQRGKKITDEAADLLIAYANNIKAHIM